MKFKLLRKILIILVSCFMIGFIACDANDSDPPDPGNPPDTTSAPTE